MRVLWVIFYLFGACAWGHGHAVHMATGEVEYDEGTKRLEVSLTVFVSDLELALVRQSEREMRMEKTPAAEFDAQIEVYLAKHFVVADAAGKVAKMKWVGREMEKASEKSGDPAVVLFFEVEMPGGVEGATLRCSVFEELFTDQVTLVEVRSGGGRKREMRFVKGETGKRLRE